MPTCAHLDQVQSLDPLEQIAGCEHCLKLGSSWVHLRCARAAGGSDAATPRRTVTPAATPVLRTIPYLRSVEPGEDWSWCVIGEVAFVLSGE
jgi:hypothetical protein